MKSIYLLLVFAAAAAAQPPIRGFRPDSARAQHDREKAFLAVPDPVRAKAYMTRMSAEPHHAGSPGSKAVAEYALDLLRGWGYDARIEEFEALLPYPKDRSLEMVSPVKFKAKLQEPSISGDPDSNDKGQLPTYNSYAATGDVTAPLVYVNYGIPADYEELSRRGIDVKGKIVIARYGQSWRGTKAKVAQEHGAVGCLIYSDPRDDGYFQGDTYPKGAYRPPQGVQRGSVMDMPLYPGDPLSPGWPSEKGSKRLGLTEASSLMKIPVLPISYGDAQPLLEQLQGPVAPESWRGALPFTYHIGPGPATVRLKLDFDWTTKPVYNVIAAMRGNQWPDEWILYGNHHDAWVNGAMDPVSGAAALLETARGFSELRKQGWQPRRTVLFALWDAEEFGLIGSTEWAEKHAEDLTSKGVFYLNSDSNGKGNLSVGSTPSLEAFFTEVLRDVPKPGGSESLLKDTRNPQGEFHVGALGAGSDYVAFYHHLGVPSANLGFSGGGFGGIYHSIYDTLSWYTHFSDTDFVYSRALSQVMGTALLRMADAEILPFDFSGIEQHVARWAGEIKKLKGGDQIDFGPVDRELEKLRSTSKAFENAINDRSGGAADPSAPAPVNQILFRAEQELLTSAGLPGRTWYKHLLAAPGTYTGYSAKTLPLIREAAEAGELEQAGKHVPALAAALSRLSGKIVLATELLGKK